MGEKIRIEDIPDDEMIKVGKKKKVWFDHYRLTKEEEEEWRLWAHEELKKKMTLQAAEKELFYIELRYGLPLKLERENKFGQLEIFK